MSPIGAVALHTDPHALALALCKNTLFGAPSPAAPTELPSLLFGDPLGRNRRAQPLTTGKRVRARAALGE